MSERPLRILLLLHELTLTGAPRIAVEAFAMLRAAGKVELEVIALKGGALESDCYNALGSLWVVSGEGLPVWRKGVRRLRRSSRLNRILNGFKPDLIYANSVASLPLAELLHLPETGIPAILHVHELDTHINHYAMKHPALFHEWPKHYPAISTSVIEALHRVHNIPKEKISLIYEFTKPLDVIPPPETRWPDVPFVVGGCGKGMWRKGMEAWLRVAVALSRQMGEDKVRFVWVGVTDDTSGVEFRETARKLRVEHLVEFVPVTREPLKHFARFDVFAMTSWEEAFGIVVLEAMLLEKPVACFSGSGGPPEVVGETGLVIPDFDPNAMAAGLAELAANPARLRLLGTAARQRVLEHFVPEVQVPKIEAVCRATVSPK